MSSDGIICQGCGAHAHPYVRCDECNKYRCLKCYQGDINASLCCTSEMAGPVIVRNRRVLMDPEMRPLRARDAVVIAADHSARKMTAREMTGIAETLADFIPAAPKDRVTLPSSSQGLSDVRYVGPQRALAQRSTKYRCANPNCQAPLKPGKQGRLCKSCRE